MEERVIAVPVVQPGASSKEEIPNESSLSLSLLREVHDAMAMHCMTITYMFVKVMSCRCEEDDRES